MSDASPALSIEPFHDERTGTVTYVLADPATRQAAIVDPVLDFDLKSGRTATTQADRVLAHLAEAGLTVQWILETHAHADHLSAARHLQERVGGRIAIGEHIREVQAVFRRLYNLERDFLPDGRQFDHLFRDGETFRIGTLEAQALLVPGHTPACLAYRIASGDAAVPDAVFVGDTMFMPDVGTARADFPGGDAVTLYRSIRRLLALPPATRLLVCHDYPPEGRDPAWETTVADQRAHNIHVHDGVDEAAFVALRTGRDATLDVPALILPSIQVNIRAGHLPPAEDNGVSYLKIPLNTLGRQ
ncbi:MBL fold metallo-hydrolase [Mitsuaria sp. GD03876]|uniref:MBL fold metallo-hydrolase n=1 Tax=Mitsuaria sp. GD03876 TaxID=2975399 RepID=UPI00244AC543|nr:MBL fold metallo-hydrolase [Mitsuaria sp. GD03876]MDH0867813.1 MBL fold metallo-hydrolase [Mitsuaria sp. GD03876]